MLSFHPKAEFFVVFREGDTMGRVTPPLPDDIQSLIDERDNAKDELDNAKKVISRQREIIKRMRQKTITRERKAMRVKELEEELAQLKKESERDPLTGIYNEKGFCIRLEKFFRQLAEFDEFKEARHESDDERPSGMFVLLDFDLFKCVNDLISPEKADVLLQMFARYLRDRFDRFSGDFFARLHGDEFLFFFRNVKDEKVIRHIFDDEIRPKLRSLIPPGVDMEEYKIITGVDYLVDATYGVVPVTSPELSFTALHAEATTRIQEAKKHHPDARMLLSKVRRKRRTGDKRESL